MIEYDKVRQWVVLINVHIHSMGGMAPWALYYKTFFRIIRQIWWTICQIWRQMAANLSAAFLWQQNVLKKCWVVCRRVVRRRVVRLWMFYSTGPWLVFRVLAKVVHTFTQS